MTQEIEGSTAGRPSIEVYATFGSFEVNNSGYVVKYASTFANPENREGHRKLLEELEPVREKLEAEELEDLGSLIQRDLNDFRVAQDLVPYLQGEKDVGFFPAILAVLVPDGYLNRSEGSVEYPEQNESNSKITYGDCWETERFRIDGNELPLGKLTIFEDESEIIVLDGQHRSSAFRYCAGEFPEENSLYETFYEDVSDDTGLDSDLPVTMIWFETNSEEQVRPQLISRQLFVDVNNSAKPVSRARTILLDDRSVTAIATQELFGHAATRSFSPGEFSLLHCAFDMDSELSTAKLPVVSITTPEIAEELFVWAFFGSDRYEELSRSKVGKRYAQKNRERFNHIFGSGTGLKQNEDEDSPANHIFPDRADAKAFREDVGDRFLEVCLSLFEELKLLEPHYEACARVEEWVENEGNSAKKEAWKDVFKGGEGLYWSFLDGEENTGGAASNRYREAISEIEDKFREIRFEESGLDDEVDSLRDIYERGFRTKAFQVGFVMAVDKLSEIGIGNGERHEAAPRLVECLNEFEFEEWAVLLSEGKERMVGGSISPRTWPAFRTMLFRMFAVKSDDVRASNYSVESTMQWFIVKNMIEDWVSSFMDRRDEIPESVELANLVREWSERAVETANSCGISDGRRRELIQKGAEEFENKMVSKAPSHIELRDRMIEVDDLDDAIQESQGS